MSLLDLLAWIVGIGSLFYVMMAFLWPTWFLPNISEKRQRFK